MLHSTGSKSTKKPSLSEFCYSCRRHLPKNKFKSATADTSGSGGESSTGGGGVDSAQGQGMAKCVNCERLDNNARTRQDLSVYKSMLNRIRRDEESKFNTSSPIYHLQVVNLIQGNCLHEQDLIFQDSDIRYIVRSLWDSRSILSGLSNLYELRMIRFHKSKEWSPWNCILLSKDEAEIHNSLENLNKVYVYLVSRKKREILS